MNRLGPIALAAVLASSVLACGGGGGKDDPSDAGVPDAMPDAGVDTFADCEAGDESFVRNAYLAALGHRPKSQEEVNVYVDIIEQTRALGESDEVARATAARAIMDAPGYVDRWAQILMDSLRVPRIEDQSMESCYGRTLRDDDGGALAAHVRDTAGSGGGDGGGRFTMLDLLRSSLELDDVSPVYRGHLYALVSRAIPAANVPPIQAELARREDFGLVFDSAYLNRDIVCLTCHNSESSVTLHPDPELNRHWPIPGLFEKAIYGQSTGIDVARAHAAFRYDDFVADIFGGDEGEMQPWGWTSSCGGFYPSGLPPDPAGVDGRFASLSGDRLTVIDLEAALGRGFDAIRGSGIEVGSGGEIADADAAFAYMVSASFVEAVWEEVIGSPLTIANYFPRNQAQRDLLWALTDDFVASGFSLRELLLDIFASDYFNRLDPEAGCGTGPYNAPAVYDPWVISDDDPERHNNGYGDAVSALSGRTLSRAIYEALEWKRPYFQNFPEVPGEYFFCQQFSCGQMASFCSDQGFCCVTEELLCSNPPGPDEPSSGEERSFQRGVGVFLKNGERGFRGLDFQARLMWENRFGACRNPTSEPDFVEGIADAASAGTATVRDVVEALKDRIIGEPQVRNATEASAIEALFGAGLDAAAASVGDLEGAARAFCGVLVSSPQFLLGGLAPRGGEPPALTPTDVGYDAVCAAIASRGLSGGLTLSCGSGSLTVSR